MRRIVLLVVGGLVGFFFVGTFARDGVSIVVVGRVAARCGHETERHRRCCGALPHGSVPPIDHHLLLETLC